MKFTSEKEKKLPVAGNCFFHVHHVSCFCITERLSAEWEKDDEIQEVSTIILLWYRYNGADPLTTCNLSCEKYVHNIWTLMHLSWQLFRNSMTYGRRGNTPQVIKWNFWKYYEKTWKLSKFCFLLPPPSPNLNKNILL